MLAAEHASLECGGLASQQNTQKILARAEAGGAALGLVVTLSPASALVVAVPRRLWVRFDAAVSAALRHITVVAFTIAPGLRLARLPTTRVPWLFLASAGGLDTSASQDVPRCDIYFANPPHSHMGVLPRPNYRRAACGGRGVNEQKKYKYCNCR